MEHTTPPPQKNAAGFSLLELVIAMSITLTLMAAAGMVFRQSLSTRERETRRTAAIVAAQSTLNLLSRELANSGYGLTDNGIVAADSDDKKVHFRSNIQNADALTDDPGEDLMYYYDADSSSVIRYDPNSPSGTPKTSTVINKAEEFSLVYWDYNGSATPVKAVTPSANTARITITITVKLEPVQGQPSDQVITYTSDVTLRNSKYISKQY